MSADFDEEGYLRDPGAWSEELAKEIALKQFGVELADKHWKCIRITRSYYEKWSSLPMVKTIREEASLTTEEFEALFKRGVSSARGVLCKICGLPRLLCISAGC